MNCGTQSQDASSISENPKQLILMNISLKDKLLIEIGSVEFHQNKQIQTASVDGMNIALTSNEVEIRFGWGITLHLTIRLQRTDTIRFIKLLLLTMAPTLTAAEKESLDLKTTVNFDDR